MAQKQSVAEQQAIIKDMREQVQSRAKTNFGYEISHINPNINNGQWILQARKINYKVPDIVKEFNNDLDPLLANRATAAIKVRLFGKKQDETIVEATINIWDYTETLPIQQQQQQTETAQTAQPQQQRQFNIQSSDQNMTVANILTLMGFGGLAGDGNSDGVEQILNVRDGLKDMRFENMKREEKINKLTADLAVTQQERDNLKKDVERLERQLEKADEEIENLELDIEEKNEQIRKLHPELSLMGTSLTALLGAGIKNFAMNHANTIGGLMGIDGDALRTMLANDEPAAIGGGEEADDNSDGRADECKQIREFIKTLNDKEWQDFYQLMRVFAANKETIAIVLAMAKGSGAKQNDEEEQQ